MPARIPIYLIPTPIGDQLNDFSVAALRLLPTIEHLFLEEDDGFAERMIEKKVISEKHDITFLLDADGDPSRAIERAVALIAQKKPLALLASSGVPCFVDPGYRLISHLLENHLEQIELTPLGLSSALDAALALAGVDMTRFVMIGHYPQFFHFPEMPFPLPWVCFVRGSHIRPYLEAIYARVPRIQRLLLLQDVRKRGRSRVRLMPKKGPPPMDLEESGQIDCVVVCVPVPMLESAAAAPVTPKTR